MSDKTSDEVPVTNRCPLCGSTVGDNDQLVAHYYAPKDWWVLSHRRRASADAPWKEHCAQARYRLVFGHY